MDAIEYANGLRELAAWVEDNADELNGSDSSILGQTKFHWFTYTKRDFTTAVRTLGRGAKSKDELWFNVDRDFGGITVQVTTARSTICERVVVGTTTKTAMVPDPDVEVPMVEVTEEVEEVEWVCPPALLREEAVA